MQVAALVALPTSAALYPLAAESHSARPRTCKRSSQDRAPQQAPPSLLAGSDGRTALPAVSAQPAQGSSGLGAVLIAAALDTVDCTPPCELGMSLSRALTPCKPPRAPAGSPNTWALCRHGQPPPPPPLLAWQPTRPLPTCPPVCAGRLRSPPAACSRRRPTACARGESEYWSCVLACVLASVLPQLPAAAASCCLLAVARLLQHAVARSPALPCPVAAAADLRPPLPRHPAAARRSRAMRCGRM